MNNDAGVAKTTVLVRAGDSPHARLVKVARMRDSGDGGVFILEANDTLEEYVGSRSHVDMRVCEMSADDKLFVVRAEECIAFLEASIREKLKTAWQGGKQVTPTNLHENKVALLLD